MLCCIIFLIKRIILRQKEIKCENIVAKRNKMRSFAAESTQKNRFKHK